MWLLYKDSLLSVVTLALVSSSPRYFLTQTSLSKDKRHGETPMQYAGHGRTRRQAHYKHDTTTMKSRGVSSPVVGGRWSLKAAIYPLLAQDIIRSSPFFFLSPSSAVLCGHHLKAERNDLLAQRSTQHCLVA